MTPISVLLIDDNPTFLQIATRLLQECYSNQVIAVGTARLGKGVLAQAIDLQPQIILVGLGPSYLTGLELITSLRTVLAAVGIVALGALDTSGYRQAALAAGADDFIPKAALNTDLLPTIRRVIQTRQPGASL